jgi:hypothetical protein
MTTCLGSTKSSPATQTQCRIRRRKRSWKRRESTNAPGTHLKNPSHRGVARRARIRTRENVPACSERTTCKAGHEQHRRRHRVLARRLARQRGRRFSRACSSGRPINGHQPIAGRKGRRDISKLAGTDRNPQSAVRPSNGRTDLAGQRDWTGSQPRAAHDRSRERIGRPPATDDLGSELSDPSVRISEATLLSCVASSRNGRYNDVSH